MKFSKVAIIGLASFALFASTSITGVQAKTRHNRITINNIRKIKRSSKAKTKHSKSVKIRKLRKRRKTVKRNLLLSYNSKKSLAVQRSVKARLQSIGYDTQNHWTSKELIAVDRWSDDWITKDNTDSYIKSATHFRSIPIDYIESYLKRHKLYRDFKHNLDDIRKEARAWHASSLSVDLIKKVPHFTPDSLYMKTNIDYLQVYDPSQKSVINQELNSEYAIFKRSLVASQRLGLNLDQYDYGRDAGSPAELPVSLYEAKIEGYENSFTASTSKMGESFNWIANTNRTTNEDYVSIDRLAAYMHTENIVLQQEIHYR